MSQTLGPKLNVLQKEKLYQKEQWFTNKTGALASTSFYFLAWVLTCALSPRPLVLLNYVAYIGVAGFFTLPLVFFVAGDFPRRRPVFWNIWLMVASWIWAYILIGEMYE
jgi:osomolarity two-component system sensor histidine kinase SLN1